MTSLTPPRGPTSADRPRERLWVHGPAALTTVELVAILIGTGRVGEGAATVADILVRSMDGSLRRLASREPAMLLATPGIGRTKASRLVAALELGQRMTREARPLPIRIRTPTDLVRHFGSRLRDLEVEEFHVLILNLRHEVTRDVLVSRGLLNASLVHPREVFRTAIAEAAAGVILVHNHPSGDPTPSPEDRVVTEQLAEAGKVVGIPVTDHVIVAGDQYVSFVTQGYL
ncbi:MAG: DNA repair protein RadC [Gemmatimonadota bacterium]